MATGLKTKPIREGWNDWVRSEADARAVANGCYFDKEKAERVEEFAHKWIRHSDGEWFGKPFDLMKWQREDLIMPLFGWMNADGLRRYRQAYVEIPKKNGKSATASLIGLYMLMADREPGARVFSAATSRDQASIVHDEAIQMVDSSPALTSVLKVNRSTKNIAFPQTNSFYRAISAEAKGSEGLKAHCVICDELHVWYGRKLWDALRYAFRTRRQPLLFVITTAGDDLKSVCYEQHERAMDLLAGKKFDERQFCYVRAMEDGDDWLDEKTWFKANPSLGITIKLADFAADVEEARQTPTSQSSFMRYSLNKWVSGGANKLLDFDAWKACGAEFSEDELIGVPCWGGLDLSKTRDMTAFALVFKLAEDDYRVLVWFWLPEATLSDRKRIPEFFRTWASEKFITSTEGNVCDYRQVRQDIEKICRRFQVTDFAYDPWNAEMLTQELSDIGIPRIEFRQSLQNFNEPTKELQRLVLNGGLKHNNNPVLNWQADNVCGYQDSNGNIRPKKPESDDIRKIDGMVAIIMALGRATATNEPGVNEAYSEPGDGVLML